MSLVVDDFPFEAFSFQTRGRELLVLTCYIVYILLQVVVERLS